MSERAVLLAAGGSGGHLFPAEALAGALSKLGFAVELVTDARALQYGKAFPARAIHTIPAATPTGGSLLGKAMAAFTLTRGTYEARRMMRRVRPLCVVGFGGYPTVPPVLAASQVGVPTLLHEQNAVMGRANRFLAGRVNAIATGFAELGKADDAIRAKATYVGNPVRPAVIAAAATPFPESTDGVLNLLVTGGSQGARVLSDVVPAAIELLDADTRARIVVVQQARGEDEARVRDMYARLHVSATVQSFFTDLPARIAAAHLVIGRSGASTVSELAVIGRPSILVPLPGAIDQDQAANAETLRRIHAADVVPQAEFTPAAVADLLRRYAADPASLKAPATAAKSAARPDAAERLAALVQRIIAGRAPSESSHEAAA